MKDHFGESNKMVDDLTKENDPNKHIPGKGCKCCAYGQHECGCDGVDWRSRREVQLEAENEELKKELAALKHQLANPNGTTDLHNPGSCLVCHAEYKRGFDEGYENGKIDHLDDKGLDELSRLRQERDAYRGAVREARGSLGYGPLETMPSTIKVVRDILDNVIATYPKKETS